MALPVYESFNEGKVPSSNCTVSKPSGVESGNLLIGFMSSDGGNETHESPEDDSWNIIYKGQSEGSGKQTFSCWWKIAGGSEPGSYTFKCTSSTEAVYAWIIRISGTHQTDPIHKKNIGTGDNASVYCPSLTTEVNDCLMLLAFGADHGDVTLDSGFDNGTIVTVDESGSGAGDCSGGLAWENHATAGNYLGAHVTLTGGEEWVGITLAIQPPAGGIFYQSVAGVFSATGSIVKLPKIPLAGVFSLTGSIASILKKFKSLVGTFGLTGIVSSIFKFPKSLAGAFGLTGNVVKLPKITLSGVLSATGTIVKLPKIILSGTFSPTGVVSSIWKSFQSLAGTFNLTGVITKLPKISLSGSFDFAGETLRKIKISLAGVFDFVGSGVGQLLGGIFYKSLAGAFDFSGGVGRKISKSIAGVFSPTGTISSILTKFKSLVGTFGLTGTISKLPKIILSGILSTTGSIAKKVMIFLSGTFEFSGNLGRLIKKGLSGAFSFIGSGVGQFLSGIFYKSLAGTFGFTGTVGTVKKVFKALSGAFNLTGIITSAFGYTKSLAGTFNLTGTVNKLIKKTLSGYISLSGYFKFRTVWMKVVKTVDTWTRVIKDGVFRRLG